MDRSERIALGTLALVVVGFAIFIAAMEAEWGREAQYRAELAPLTLKVAVDAETRKPTARFDLTRFSSWARQSQPALITFGTDRRPEHLNLPMILGTSVQISLKTG